MGPRGESSPSPAMSVAEWTLRIIASRLTKEMANHVCHYFFMGIFKLKLQIIGSIVFGGRVGRSEELARSPLETIGPLEH